MNKEMINLFKKQLTEKRNQIKKLEQAQIDSEDKEERASLGTTIAKIRDEINEMESVLKGVEDESPIDDEESVEPEGRSKVITKAELRGAGAKPKANKDEEGTDSIEYRTAFMNFVCRGAQIPAEVRANAMTSTTDASAVIPTTIMNEIIKELKVRGNVWNKVRKTNIAGGVEVPILDLMPTATWIGETTGAESQKLSAKTKVSFKYFGLECKLSQSLLTNVTTLDMFQQQFVELATEAIITALEIGVFNGTGSGQMTGILKDARVTKVVELTEAEIAKWDVWKKKVFAKISKAYSRGTFYMAEETYQGYIDGMVDTNGQPVARTNYGIDSDPSYRFGGKVVETVENDIIPAYEDATDVFAVFADLNHYCVNSNLQMKVDKWEDKDTHEIKNNCMLICDGKILDPNGVIIIKKKASA